jgi:hypothetical protein
MGTRKERGELIRRTFWPAFALDWGLFRHERLEL